ncbi:hypothetical protein ACP70R_034498 [Stipagrostis hirtigluma subsp. patula]
MYLPDSYFTTVLGEDGEEKLVYSFTGKEEEKIASGSKSKIDDMILSYSAELHPAVKSLLGD